jgi:pimeloyl-ACP methyl ester carboxylesterase
MATFMLVHGACTGGWCWEKVTPLLEANGHRVCAPDLPGLGNDNTPPANVTLADNVEKLSRLLDKMEEPVVLVGHSLGGITISSQPRRRRGDARSRGAGLLSCPCCRPPARPART